MKPTHIFRTFLLAAGSSLLAVSSASAQNTNGTWSANADGAWSLNTNWTSNTIADGSGFTANFTNNITADRTVRLDTDRTITNVVFSDSTPSSAGNWILNNNGVSTNNLILAGTTPTITVNALGTGKTATISAIIEGTAGLTKSGAGTLVLTGANTYTGTTTISAGTLQVSNTGAIPATSAVNLTGSSAKMVLFSSSQARSWQANSAVADSIFGAGYEANMAIDGNSATRWASGVAANTGVDHWIYADLGTAQNLSKFSINWEAAWSTSFVLQVSNDATNWTTASSNFNGATASPFQTYNFNANTNGRYVRVYSDTGFTNLVSLWEMQAYGSTASNTGIYTIGSLAGVTGSVVDLQGIGSTLKAGSDNTTTNFAGTLAGGASDTFVKEGSGNLTLSASNTTFTGLTRIDAGTLTLGHGTNTLADTGAVNVNGGELALGTNIDTVGAVTLTSGSITGSGAGTLTGTGSAYDVRSGSVSAKLGGTVGLTKSTTGNVTLTGDNSYSGATTVSNGTLEVSAGNINSTSGISITGGELRYGSTTGLTRDVTVNGGTFRYNSTTDYSGTLTYTNGTLAGTRLTGTSFDNQVIGTGKTISPGNSPGTMNVGSQTWAGGGSYLFEINDVAGTAGADPGWDLLSGSGTLTITATSLTPFVIDLTSLTALNAAGNVSNFVNTTNYFWMLADFANPVGGFDADAFSVNTSNFSNTFTGSFAVALGSGISGGDNTQLYLTYTAVPEPNVAALLGGLGTLMLLRRRR